MNTADVNQIMSEIQRTWAYLESLFIHSEEVKKELPEATERFARIDTDVKSVGVFAGDYCALSLCSCAFTSPVTNRYSEISKKLRIVSTAATKMGS